VMFTADINGRSQYSPQDYRSRPQVKRKVGFVALSNSTLTLAKLIGRSVVKKISSSAIGERNSPTYLAEMHSVLISMTPNLYKI